MGVRDFEVVIPLPDLRFARSGPGLVRRAERATPKSWKELGKRAGQKRTRWFGGNHRATISGFWGCRSSVQGVETEGVGGDAEISDRTLRKKFFRGAAPRNSLNLRGSVALRRMRL